MMKRFGIALLLALTALVPLSRAEAAWPDDGSYTAWSHKFKITSQASKINGVLDWYWLDLADMPPAFHAAAQVDLDDFRVTSDGETAIDYNLIYYDAGTDTGLVAIAQPHGSGGASSDVDSYVYIGNAGASSASTTSAFPSNLEALYMLQEAPTSSTAVLDRTANARHSSAIAGSMTSGDLITGGPHSGLKCIDFDSNDRITVPSTIIDDAETANAYTWFGWLKPEDEDADVGAFGSTGSQLTVRHESAGDFAAISRNSANSANFTASGGISGEMDAWNFVCVVYNGSTLKLYINGAEISSVTATSFRSTTLNFYLGHDNVTYWRGKLAEMGIYSGAFSGDQVATMHTNPTDSGFWVVTEVSIGGGGGNAGSFFFG